MACYAQSAAEDLFIDNLNEVIVENENARQLRIYSDALMQGVSDTIRLDAAIGLLIRKDKESRDVLIDAIGAKDNIPACMAVCRALIKGRSLGAAAGSLDMFLLPLIDTLRSTDAALARLGAEALLVYRFDQIGMPLSELVSSATADKQARLNGIYALQLRTEPDALRYLIQLLNDTDPEIVRGAELALQEVFGVPVGTGKQVWEKISQEINQKDPAEIRRERLLRQETRLREIQAERDRWQKLFLAALDKEFELVEAAAKTTYLLDKLSSDLPAIRLWALDKVQRFQTDAAAGLRDKLLLMLADENRQVRLAAAKVWSTMSALNPAERLMERYKEETDPQVAVALFEALGEACFFAFSPGSKVVLSPEFKTQTMLIADSYASKEDPEMAKKGAEVLRKLLELDGLTPKEATKYLETIKNRYLQETDKKGPVRGDLLAIMARLCSQGSQKVIAVKLYQQIFEDVLRNHDENSLVRQSAAAGMVSVDPTAAMKLFRELNINMDSSPTVRLIMIYLAGQSGTIEDMGWLMEQLGSNGEGELAWTAVMDILKRQDAKLVAEWSVRLEQSPSVGDQIREVLELAEQKAEAQKEGALLCDLQVRLLKWHLGKGSYEHVAAYREKLELNNTASVEVKKKALNQTNVYSVEAYLQLRKYSKISDVIGGMLRENTLSDKSEVLDVINSYFLSEKGTTEDKSSLLEFLSEISITNQQRWWQDKLEQWRKVMASNQVTPVTGNGGMP
ncbi:MAG: hypothetical protein JXB18_03590 [Sedimentisphaerales bacterium]|nr:hypothetical protein [Sedimentisphaerales bacterium]